MRRDRFTIILLSLAFASACSTEGSTLNSPAGGTGNSSGTTNGTSAHSTNSNGGSSEQASSNEGGADGQDSQANGGSNASSSSRKSNAGGSDASGGTKAASGGSKAASGGTKAASGGATTNIGGTKTTGGSVSIQIGGATATKTDASTSTAGGTASTSSTETPLPIVAVGGSHSGEATFYDPNGNGNCSFGTSVLGMDIAALNNPDYSMAAWCGACAEVTGPKGKITVFIQDRCPECKSGDLDLNPEAFDKIADHAAGRVKITWNFVSCAVTGPVKYHFKEGSSAGWTAVQILNHRLPVAKFEYSTDNGSTWKAVNRVEYNYFLEESGFGPYITRVRITSSTGETLTDMLPIPSSDRIVEGAANF